MFNAQNPAVIDSWDQSMSEMQSNLMKEKYFGAINQLKRKKKTVKRPGKTNSQS